MPPRDPNVRHQAGGCVTAILGVAVIIAFASIEFSSYAAEHPPLFVNKPGWAETTAFGAGFLTTLLAWAGLVPTGFLIRGRPRTRGRVLAAWASIAVDIPMVIVTAMFAMLAVPWKGGGSCGTDLQHCAYLQQHPWVILAVIAGGLAGSAIFMTWFKAHRPEWTQDEEPAAPR
jgi:hypothetical protein